MMFRPLLVAVAAAGFCTPLLAQDAPAQADPAATAPAAAAAQSALPNGLSAPAAGKGQVVFFRKGGFVGAAISCAVHENGGKLSSLPPGRYYVQAADPGIHNYAVKSEATDTLRLEVEAGETYYAQCAITMGIMAGHPNLSPSTSDAFGILKDKLKLVDADKKVKAD